MCSDSYDQETEYKITLEIAKTFRFMPTENKQSFTCGICDARFYKRSIGKPLNERMISHHESHRRIMVGEYRMENE